MKYKNQEITHGLFTVGIPLDTFLVTAREKSCSRSFIVIAKNETDAIARFTCNVRNGIEAIKKSLPPEAFQPTKAHVHDEADMKRAKEIAEVTSLMQDKLAEYDEKQASQGFLGELDEVRVEGLRADIKTNYELIKKLREPKEVEVPPVANECLARLSELLEMKLTAQKLNPDTIYSVSYFDDPRDYYSANI